MRISGRLGRKADMATIKEWEHGDHSMGEVYTHIDYGAASALTRMGVTGKRHIVRAGGLLLLNAVTGSGR